MQLIRKLQETPHKIFLIDALGALLTAVLLFFIVGPFEKLFGMPTQIAQCLALIAMGFAVYSLACFWVKPTKWRPFLAAISVANLIYCFATIFLITSAHLSIKPLGYAYFIGEIIVILALVRAEWWMILSGERGKPVN